MRVRFWVRVRVTVNVRARVISLLMQNNVRKEGKFISSFKMQQWPLYTQLIWNTFPYLFHFK